MCQPAAASPVSDADVVVPAAPTADAPAVAGPTSAAAGPPSPADDVDFAAEAVRTTPEYDLMMMMSRC